jgi:hypothetical protein
MEVIFRDYGGYYFYYVNVATPPTIAGTNIPNPTWEIVNVKIAPRNQQNEITSITVDKLAMGEATTFHLFIFRYYNGYYLKETTYNITVGATIEEFKNALQPLNYFF